MIKYDLEYELKTNMVKYNLKYDLEYDFAESPRDFDRKYFSRILINHVLNNFPSVKAFKVKIPFFFGNPKIIIYINEPEYLMDYLSKGDIVKKILKSFDLNAIEIKVKIKYIKEAK